MLRHLRSGMVLDGVTLKPAIVHCNDRVRPVACTRRGWVGMVWRCDMMV